MTKKAFFTGIALIAAFSLLDVPIVLSESQHLANGTTISLTGQAPSNNSENLGLFSVGFNDDFRETWNGRYRSKSTRVKICVRHDLVESGSKGKPRRIYPDPRFPNEGNLTLYEGSITLGGKESALFNYVQYMPENLQIYGRYSLRPSSMSDTHQLLHYSSE